MIYDCADSIFVLDLVKLFEEKLVPRKRTYNLDIKMPQKIYESMSKYL